MFRNALMEIADLLQSYPYSTLTQTCSKIVTMQFRSQQYCNTMTVSALLQQQLHAFAKIPKYDVNTGDELGLF